MRKFLLAAFALLLSSCALAQQAYVPRYDVFTGYSYLAQPKLNLAERGFNGQFGLNANRWLAIGVDYSVFTGHTNLFPSELKPAIQAQVPPIPGLYVPFDSTTWTLTAGPQFNYRKFKKVTLFVHPGLGMIHEGVTTRPQTTIQSAVVHALVPSGKKSDLTYFYGFGGGFDLNLTKHVALRAQADYVRTYLFDDLLNSPRNAVRVSVGPTWRFGKNVR